jgi:hypothetical protein
MGQLLALPSANWQVWQVLWCFRHEINGVLPLLACYLARTRAALVWNQLSVLSFPGLGVLMKAYNFPESGLIN